MKKLEQRLVSLGPSLRYTLEEQGDTVLVTLLDPAVPAQVQRSLDRARLGNADLVNTILEDALRELRRRGSQLPLSAQLFHE